MKVFFYILTVLPVLVACETTTTNQNEIVYISTGAIQCENKGMTEIVSAQRLIDGGVDVISSQCAYLSGLAIAAQCGLGDTRINLHTISINNLADAQALGFEPTSSLQRRDDRTYLITDCSE